MALKFRKSQLANDAVDSDILNVADDYSFTGAIVVPTPTASTQAANKAYVDGLINGVDWKQSVKAGTTADLESGAAGFSATAQTIQFNGGVDLDSVAVQLSDRVLLKDMTKAYYNGIYSLTTDGRALGASIVLEIDDFSGFSAGIRQRAILTITTNGNIVDSGGSETAIQITDKANTTHTLTFGSNVTKGGSANVTAGNIVTVVNALNSGNSFEAKANNNVVTIDFVDSPSSGNAGGARGSVVNNAGGSMSFGAAAFSNVTTGSTITLQDEGQNNVVFDCIASTAPDPVGNQFALSASNSGLRNNIRAAVNAHAKFSAEDVRGFDNKRVKIIIVATGSAGNTSTVVLGSVSGTAVDFFKYTGADETNSPPRFSLGQAVGASTLTRTTDMDASDEFSGSAVYVQEGTTLADQGFVCTNDGNVVVGTDDIAFVQFTGLGGITAGKGLSKTGSKLELAITANQGLGYTGSGDAQTVNVIIDASKALAFDGSGNIGLNINTAKGLAFASNQLQVEVDDSTIGFDSGNLFVKALGIDTAQLAAGAVETAKLDDNAITLAKLGYSASLEEFSAVGSTLFTLGNHVSDASYRTSASIRAYLNGQRLRNSANMGSGMLAGSYFVYTEGGATKIAIKAADALASGDIFLVDYIH